MAERLYRPVAAPARGPAIALRGLAGLFAGAAVAAVGVAAQAQEAVATAPVTPAATAEERLQALEAELGALRAQINDLKAQHVAEVRDLRDTEAKQPKTIIANGRPGIASADGKFTANFHVVTQLDGAEYKQPSAGPVTADFRRSGPALGANAGNVDLAHARELKSGDLFRRARIGIDGTAFGDWDYRILFDFGGAGVENAGQLYETWIQYSGLKPFRFRVGAFAPSLGMDDQASTSSMPFLERAAITDVSRGLAAGDTRTAAQIFAGGDHWFANAAVTGRTVGVISTGNTLVLTSSATATAPVTVVAGTAQTFGDQLGFTGRVGGTPLHGQDWLVHLGANGSYVTDPPNGAGLTATGAAPVKSIAFSNTQEVRVDGTRLINTGNIPARNAATGGLEFAAQKQNLLLQAEYQTLHVTRSDGLPSPTFGGFYATGAWVLTGERRAYNNQSGAFDAVPVARPFNLRDGGLGAWELVARYSDIDLNYHGGAAGLAPAADSIRGGQEKDFTVGLNWYPNTIVRFMADYTHVDIGRLSPNAALYQTPAGAQIGQRYNVFSGRAQFAF